MDNRKPAPIASDSSSSSSSKNKSKNSSSVTTSTSFVATVSSSEITKSTKRNTMLPQRVRRVLQNYLLIWLDAYFDESKEDYKKSLQNLRHIVTSVTIFRDADECVDFLSTIEKEKVFMIISGSLGQQIIPLIQDWPQLESVYVFGGNQSVHEQWARKTAKVKEVYTKIEPLCKALQMDRENCDRAMISISFDGIDSLFMYTQLLKETFLEIEDDDEKSIQELVEYCRLQDDISKDNIDKVERDYHNHEPIWWYTAPYFMYSMLNRGLRLMEIDIIVKMGFFIRHLHQNIQDLYHEQQQSANKTTSMMAPFQVFRGQGLATEVFDKIKQTKGRLMSFNNFLSTSRDRTISEVFARSAADNPNLVGILFVMFIDPILCEKSSIPFVDVNKVGYYEDGEEEILFSTHTIFRIDRIERIDDEHTDRLWQVNLTLTGNNDHALNELTEHIRQELNWTTGWSRLGDTLIKLGESVKAEQLYKILLENSSTSSDKNQAGYYYYQLGLVYINIGEYPKALSLCEQSLEIMKIALPPNHPDLATSYNNIGEVYMNVGEYSKALLSYEKSFEIMKIALPPNYTSLATYYSNIGSVYMKMGEYSKALLSYEQSLEIRKIALPPNHPSLATSHNNIGEVYRNMGEYSKALLLYEQSLEIMKIALLPNHPDLATSYNNIGSVYMNMGEYSKALSSYERSLEIRKIALPSNHPDFAISYNNIGLVYNNMDEYSKALSYYEKGLEISKIALPPNHPDLATSYNNIGEVYRKMGEYSKALLLYEQSLEIMIIALPPNHPDLATSYNNIGGVYMDMGEYSKALLLYERSLEIMKIALPPNHLLLATSHNNIGEVYRNMGEYSKALLLYEQSLEIMKIALPPNHSLLATSYNNIGAVYYSMGEYSKALSSYKQSLEIKKIALPSNHSSLAASHNNIGVVYHNMSRYSKALSYYQKAHEIWQKSLPPTHPHITTVKNSIEIVKSKL